MTIDPDMPFRAAIYGGADAGAQPIMVVHGTLDTVIANTPAGGAWRLAPAGLRRLPEMPPLGQVPETQVGPRRAVPRSPTIDSGVVPISRALPPPPPPAARLSGTLQQSKEKKS